MKKLLIGLFMLTSVGVSAQFATYTPVPTPQVQLPGQSQTQQQPTRPTVREQPQEQVFRTTGYYENMSGKVSRVTLKFTVQEDVYTKRESITIVSYQTADIATWQSANARAYSTGYGDPKDFGYKVGLICGTVYFNY